MNGFPTKYVLEQHLTEIPAAVDAPIRDTAVTHPEFAVTREPKLLILLAGGPGFEPRLTESESAVLPLNYPPRRNCPPRRAPDERFQPARRAAA